MQLNGLERTSCVPLSFKEIVHLILIKVINKILVIKSVLSQTNKNWYQC